MAAFARFVVPAPRRERHFRHINGLDLEMSNTELRRRYRFSRESIKYISNLIKEDVERKTRRNHALTVDQQVLVTLRFLASGSFLQVIGDTLGIDKSTVSRTVHAVCEALCAKEKEFVRWPTSDADLCRTKTKFFEIAGFPNVIGAVDGTHVRIQAPHIDEPSYVNRKGFHSINVQAVCDADGKITNINAAWPGCSHDAHVFRTSELCRHMERPATWEQKGTLLGDSGYPCRPFLMTPYLHANGPPQESFNRRHKATRCVIERTFGRWKRRFHVLHSEIRMRPDRACKVIVACGVLFNLSLIRNEPDLDDDDDDDDDAINDIIRPYNGPQDGRNVRDHITRAYFTQRVTRAIV